MTSGIRTWLAFAVVCLGFFMALLDSTIVAVTLPTMTQFFGSDIETIAWVVNGYNLAFAVLLITASRIADQFGRKRVFVLGVALFTVTSYLAGLSSTANTLIVVRVVQGLSAALIVPVSMPIILGLFPVEKSGLVVGLWAAVSGVAAASGPALGGIIADFLHWQWIFFVNIPLGVIAVVGTLLLIGESYDRTASRTIDWFGIASLSAGSFALTLGLIQSNDRGWCSPYILSLFALAAAGLVVFALVETRIREPMLPMALLRIRPFVASCLTLLTMGIGLMCGVFFLSFFLVTVQEMTQLRAGLIIATMPIAAVFFSVVSGPLSDRIGAVWFAASGTVLLGVALWLFGDLNEHSTLYDIVWRLVIAGAGFGLSLPAVVGAAVRSVPADKFGIGSGVANMARILGMVLGVAVLVMLLTRYADQRIEDAKSEARTLVTSSTTLRADIRDQFLRALQGVRFSEHARLPTKEEVLARLEAREQASLANVKGITRAIAEAVYKKQKDEVTRLFPQVRGAFKSAIAGAFSRTFRTASVSLVLCLLATFFCEPGVRRSVRDPRSTAGGLVH